MILHAALGCLALLSSSARGAKPDAVSRHHAHHRNASALHTPNATREATLRLRNTAMEAHIGIFILSTPKNGGSYFRRNAMAAHQTWAK